MFKKIHIVLFETISKCFKIQIRLIQQMENAMGYQPELPGNFGGSGLLAPGWFPVETRHALFQQLLSNTIIATYQSLPYPGQLLLSTANDLALSQIHPILQG